MNWPRLTFLSLEWVWSLCGAGCLAGGALILLRPRTLEALNEYLEGLESSSRGRWAPWMVFGLLVPCLPIAHMLAQYASYQMSSDSGIICNAAWNALHGNGYTASALAGKSYFAAHFTFTLVLLSPVLWLWESTAALGVVQAAAVGSTPLALYLIARRHHASALPAWLMAVIALSSPFFYELTRSIIDGTVFALPFFLWAAFCWESGRRWTSALFLFLVASTLEQAPFLFFGLGLWLLVRSRDKRARLAAAGALAASVLLWYGEMAVLEHARTGWEDARDWWARYDALGANKDEIVRTTLLKPWRIAIALVTPVSKLWTPIKAFLLLGLLPLAAGARIIPALVVWFPQQLSDPCDFQLLVEHYAAFVGGPLLWCAAHGLHKRFKRPLASRRRLVAWLLCVCGASLLLNSRFHLPDGLFPSTWRTAGPRALEHIPAGAKVWADPHFLANTAMRQYVKFLPSHPDERIFVDALFVPDRVLLSRGWLRVTDPRARAKVMTMLRDRGFTPIFSEGDLIVLSNPATSGNGSETVKWIPRAGQTPPD